MGGTKKMLEPNHTYNTFITYVLFFDYIIYYIKQTFTYNLMYIIKLFICYRFNIAITKYLHVNETFETNHNIKQNYFHQNELSL